jgi:hypothetical protein
MAAAPILATKTLEAIDAAIFADQGRLFRHHLRQHILDVDDAFDDSEHDTFRSHLGISMSGRECGRELWYHFRWTTPNVISGKMLRLFNRGHLEEARFVAMLRTIGVEIWREETPGQQFRVSLFGGHYGSAIDGVARGIPDMPEIPVLTEFKTHNDKSFKKLAGEKDSDGQYVIWPQGVQKSKVEHYAQVQQYMGYYKLEWALYGAVNKDTDELYFELVPYDRGIDEGYKQRSHRIMWAKEAPARISSNPSFWKCRYCNERKVCHYAATPALNCRTCAASRPVEDGTWWCDTHSCVLDKTRQLSGCPDWQEHPSFQT